MRRLTLASLTIGMLACGATAPASTAPTATTPAVASAQYLGPVTTTVNYDGDHHVHLAPPPPTATPAIPWTSAVNSCAPFCNVAQTKAPVVELVSFSDDQYADADTKRPYYQNVLAYAVMWRGVPCVTFGAGSPPPKCDDFFLVAATTGQRLSSYQIAVG